MDYYLDKKQGRAAAESDASRKAAARQAYEAQKKPRHDPSESEHLRAARNQHEQALKRIQEIKNRLKVIEKEEKDLETETYVKSRVMTTSFSGRGREDVAGCGRRLKEIQIKLRELASERTRLVEEKDRINQG
jgi:hypothetical protein